MWTYPPADWLFWWCISPCWLIILGLQVMHTPLLWTHPVHTYGDCWLIIFVFLWIPSLLTSSTTLSITNPPCIQSNHIKCSCFVYPVNNFFARPFCHVNDDDLIMISANGWIHMMRRTCCRLSSPTTSVSYSCRWPSSTSPFARCCSWCHRMQGWSLRLFLYTSLCCFRCCECG